MRPDGGPSGPTTSYTYHQHVAPIVEARCSGCHGPDGVAELELNTYAALRFNAATAARAVEEHVMPPFPPDDQDCQPLSDRRNMQAMEREILIEWARGGTPEGDPDQPPEIEIELPPDLLGAPSRVLPDQVTYRPRVDSDDDEYRCFLLDDTLSEDWTFLRSAGLEADNFARVHHAIIYAIPPGSAAEAEAREASEPGRGWECYFGPQVDGAFPIGGHTPGSIPRDYVGGTSVPLERGTRFAIEMHFHDTNNTDPITFGVALWEFDEPIYRYPSGLDFFTSDFFIPAGDPDVRVTVEGRFVGADEEPRRPEDPNEVQEAREGLIWAVDFHMHLRGKTARIDLVRADGRRQCLLWVPDWTDEWQGAYIFEEPVRAFAGDRIEATCHWDNSTENQPTVNGERVERTALWWGFDALDEMCNGGVALTHDD